MRQLLILQEAILQNCFFQHEFVSQNALYVWFLWILDSVLLSPWSRLRVVSTSCVFCWGSVSSKPNNGILFLSLYLIHCKMSVRRSICLSVNLSVYEFVFLSVYQSVSLWLCLSVYQSVYLSVNLFVCLLVCSGDRSCYANLQLSRTIKTIVNLHSMTCC